MSLAKTQAQILRHHGGDAEFARNMITQSYARRHDVDFWAFWNAQIHASIQKNDTLMDLGAGVGQFVEDLAIRYPNNPVVGIEAAEYMLAAQTKLPENAHILKDDLNDPAANIADGQVAAVMANMLVHELVQPVQLFKAVHKWLKPGGRFCVIDLVRQPLSSYLDHKFPEQALWNDAVPTEELETVFEHFLEHNRYHTQDLIYLLESVGFTLIETTEYARFVRLVVEK